jgi:uncharacterized protein YcbK (DUF882 family)
MKKDFLLSRRTFVKSTLQICAGFVLSSPLTSLAVNSSYRPLSFFHTHTGERLVLDVANVRKGGHVLEELNTFLRDFRTGDVHIIDTKLINTLCGIQQCCGHEGDIQIISGYRSPKTNSQLRSRSSGVAKKSLHMKGRALDIRLTGLKTKTLQKIAISLKHRGVGYYPKSDFVHIDTGRVRYW